MCQIVSFVTTTTADETIKYLRTNSKTIKKSLNRKGGESYSFFAINEIEPRNYILKYVTEPRDYDTVYEEFINEVRTQSIKLSKEFGDSKTSWAFVFFSRQAPEMEVEGDDALPAPYKINNKLVWMHGTIANIPEIEKKLGKKIKIDSEVLAYYDEFNEYDLNLKGVYLGLVCDLFALEEEAKNELLFNNEVIEYFDIYYNGIGLWTYIDTNAPFVSTWVTTDSSINDHVYSNFLKIADHEKYLSYYYGKRLTNHKHVVYVAYSGGMDITMSLYAFLNDIVKVYGNLEYRKAFSAIEKKEIKLIYFDYGARARKQEVESLNKYYEFLKQEFPDIKFTVEIYDVQDMFKQLGKFSEYESKLLKNDSSGEVAEAESNLAYVPYRNTEFGLIIGSLIDRDLNENENIEPQVLFGLNLTELGVYVDNTEAWLESMQKIIEYGGKEYKKVEVIAPFINVTKTNMLAFMIKEFGYDKTKQLLDISFSCYYPTEDGKPCGKCGSCILREKALERALKRIKKDFLKESQHE